MDDTAGSEVRELLTAMKYPGLDRTLRGTDPDLSGRISGNSGCSTVNETLASIVAGGVEGLTLDPELCGTTTDSADRMAGKECSWTVSRTVDLTPLAGGEVEGLALDRALHGSVINPDEHIALKDRDSIRRREVLPILILDGESDGPATDPLNRKYDGDSDSTLEGMVGTLPKGLVSRRVPT